MRPVGIRWIAWLDCGRSSCKEDERIRENRYRGRDDRNEQKMRRGACEGLHSDGPKNPRDELKQPRLVDNAPVKLGCAIYDPADSAKDSEEQSKSQSRLE